MENVYALPFDAGSDLQETGLMLACCPQFAEKFVLMLQRGVADARARRGGPNIEPDGTGRTSAVTATVDSTPEPASPFETILQM